jgi:Tol biopolymer transport system component
MVAFFGFGDSGDTQIFVAPLHGDEVQQLTQGRGYVNTMPRWSPDGSAIYYYEQRPGTSFRTIPVSGGASQEVRPWKWESHTHAELSPDGSLIAYLRQAAQGEENTVDQTVIEDVKSRTQRTTALTILPRCWSSDSQTVLGHTTVGPSLVAGVP